MVNLSGKRLLVLGGSRISCQIVRKAQEMGIYVMVTDWYPVEKSPAKQIADKAFTVSTADVDAIVKLIRDEKVDGVITGFTDSVLPYYAQICKKAGLPCYGTEEQFDMFINKRKYKALCKRFGVPTIDEYTLDDSLNPEDLGKIKYPVLVKPSDNSGARGISICNNENELINAYKKAKDFSQAGEILVERYISGKEVTVFWLFKDGEAHLTGLGNRHVKHNQEGVIALPVGYTFPSIFLNNYIKNVEPKVKKMLNSVGIRDGMMFMQCLVEDGECVVYDIGYRLTGSLEYILQEEIYGYNPLTLMIQYALTGKTLVKTNTSELTPFWKKYACNVSFLIKPGTIGEIWP